MSCSSGTAALHTAYAALGLGAGDEVVTTPLTFVATASTALQLGATVAFADVLPDNALIDPDAVAALLGDHTRAVAAVDYAGHPCDYDRLREVTTGQGVRLVADAAHSLGSTYRGRPVGDLADLTTLSFFPTKNVTTAEGGAVVALDDDLARRAREFRGIGLVRDKDRFELTDEGGWHQEVHTLGLNYRLSDVARGARALASSAAWPSSRPPGRDLRALHRGSRRRRGSCARLPSADDVDPTWHLYPVRVRDGRRREVYDALRGEGILVQVNYLPVYWHPLFSDLGYSRGMCPNAEAYYAEQLSLPMFVDLTDTQVDRVCDALRRVLA